MLLSAVSDLVVAQSSSEIPEELMNNPVYKAIPLQAWRGCQGSRKLRLSDIKTIGIWRWSGCQPYTLAAWYSFLLEDESHPTAIIRPEGLYQWKFPMTLWGIERANFRLVAQCIHQLHSETLVSIYSWRHPKIPDWIFFNFLTHSVSYTL